MTHRECIDVVAKHVKSKFSCGVVLKEIKTLSSEIADIIGFGGSYRSVLVEVKVSRSDFLVDNNKATVMVNPYCLSLTGNIWNDGFEIINLQSERDILYSALRRKLTPKNRTT